MGAMDEDIMRDLRGRQFEWEVREASDRATSNRLLTTTEKDQGDATGTLVHAAVAKLVSRLGPANAAEAVLRIGKKLRRFRANDLHEMVLNPVEEAVHDLFQCPRGGGASVTASRLESHHGPGSTPR